MEGSRIRAAELEDLPELVRIYNHYVRETPITFDVREFEVDRRRSWFAGFSRHGPHRFLVADASGDVLGYASSGVFRVKPAYARSVETTIYLDPAACGRGIGTLLYGSLLTTLREEPTVHRAFAGIALPNPASVALHDHLGFRPIGTFHEVGFKFERYWDVSWYERDLSDADAR